MSPIIAGYPVLTAFPGGPFYLREQIGSGGTSTVWRALLPPSQMYAVKIVHVTSTNALELKKVDREFRIHQTLKHDHILKIVAAEKRSADCSNGVDWPEGLYIAMDLAGAGDLFDHIAPDFGVIHEIAHLYLHQLVEGLKYLRKAGICHRDIKPENLLLSGEGNLMISDFGLASVYKYKGQQRQLTDRCGSPPYAAPELARVAPYDGPPVDIWSAGIVFFTLLVGNTPWDEPTRNSPEFQAYQADTVWRFEPWDRIHKGAMRTLLKGLLQLDPAKRFTVAEIERADWYAQSNHHMLPDTGLVKNGAAVFKILAEGMRRTGYAPKPSQAFEELCDSLQSTTLNGDGPSASQAFLSQRNLDHQASFQASIQLYSVLSQAPSQAGSVQTKRFFSILPLSELVSALATALNSSITTPRAPLSITYPDPEQTSTGTTLVHAKLAFKLVDRRKMNLFAYLDVKKGSIPAHLLLGAGLLGGEDGRAMEGWDVTMWKKYGDNTELLRVWKDVVEALPSGVVFTM